MSVCCPVQGIDAKARSQLLALALCALEEQLAAVPDAAIDGSAQQWRALTGALLASCSVAAARAWLGYVPVELQQQSAALAARCQQPGEGLLKPSLCHYATLSTPHTGSACSWFMPRLGRLA